MEVASALGEREQSVRASCHKDFRGQGSGVSNPGPSGFIVRTAEDLTHGAATGSEGVGRTKGTPRVDGVQGPPDTHRDCSAGATKPRALGPAHGGRATRSLCSLWLKMENFCS